MGGIGSGGKGGRKAKDGAKGLVGYAIRITPYQRDKLRSLGGSIWIREQINKAPVRMKKFIALSIKGRDSLEKLMDAYLKPEDRHDVSVWEEAVRYRSAEEDSMVLVFPGICTKAGKDLEVEFDDDDIVWETATLR